uniref:Polynucleotide adenylyltransferase n=1 Tax=Percolomonas cosmopolitus TaxID=63605 RepID=A0A7S1KL45_9EUKA|mmetsp:Transcript_10584/g.39427  ORF Transcript_10584/g.39427 Transcript_10584/m.39427 type:complete len:581 (+) Transcript_10584:208-1950(+)
MSSFLEESPAMSTPPPSQVDTLSLFRSQSNTSAEYYLTQHLHNQTVSSLPDGVAPGEGMKRIRSLREKVRLMKEKKQRLSSEKQLNHRVDSSSTHTPALHKNGSTVADAIVLSDSDDSPSDESDSDAHTHIFQLQNGATHGSVQLHLAAATTTESFHPQNEFISIGATNQSKYENDKTDFIKTPWKGDTPWIKNGKEYDPHPTLALHQEIIDFVRLIEETDEERKYRIKIIESIQNIILQMDTTAEFELYGSFPVKLMIPGSDVDILMKSKRIDNKSKNKAFMFKLRNALQASGLVSQVQVIVGANVPIMKIQERKTQHWFDLHVDYDRSKNVNLVVNFVNSQLETYPALRYLVLVVKYFLKQRGMNDAATGGMSSFGVFLMCLSMMQQHDSSFDEDLRSKTSLGHLLLDFFALYGIYFNYSKVAISVTRGGSYMPKVRAAQHIVRPAKFKMTGEHANRLVILDPLDKTNCVTYITKHIETIRYAFANAFKVLVSKWKSGESLLSRVIPADHVLFSRAAGLKNIYFDGLNQIYGGGGSKNHVGSSKKKRKRWEREGGFSRGDYSGGKFTRRKRRREEDWA